MPRFKVYISQDATIIVEAIDSKLALSSAKQLWLDDMRLANKSSPFKILDPEVYDYDLLDEEDASP